MSITANLPKARHVFPPFPALTDDHFALQTQDGTISRSPAITKRIQFTKTYVDPPAIALALAELDISGDQNLRVEAVAKDLTTESFTLWIDRYYTTLLYNATCNFFEFEPEDPDFQCGRFNLGEHHPWHCPQSETEYKISFRNPYSRPPRVVLWLAQIDMAYVTAKWSLRCYTTHITPKDFNVHIDARDGSILYGAAVCWVAYPADKVGVTSGTFSSNAARASDPPHPREFNGHLSFGKPFESIPNVLFGLTSFDFGRSYSLRIKTSVTGITQEGIDWYIGTWADTILHFAEVSYLAIAI